MRGFFCVPGEYRFPQNPHKPAKLHYLQQPKPKCMLVADFNTPKTPDPVASCSASLSWNASWADASPSGL